MRATLVTGPALEPVTLAEAKAHARVDHDDDDAVLLGLIATARTHVENTTGRALISQTWRLSLDAWPGHGAWYSSGGWALGQGETIRLPKMPVQSITAIEHLDAAGIYAELASSSYRLINGDVAPAVAPVFNGSWPSMQDTGDAVRVTFVAGYGDYPSAVPAPLRHAILVMVAHLYANKEAVSPQVMTQVPLTFDSLLSTYRTVLA